MKKVLTSLMIVASVYSLAQVSVSGDNAHAPEATLDVKAIGGTTADGVLIPRVDRARAQNMPNVKHSTLIYVEDASTGAKSGKANQIDAKGFYYFDTEVGTSGEWVKLGGSASADNSIYVADGSIDGGNRVVTQNDNNVTYTTGTGEFIIDGTSRLAGGSYVAVKEVETSSYTVQPTDYYIAVRSNSTQVEITVPEPSPASAGRVLIISNAKSTSVAINTPDGKQALNGTEAPSIPRKKAMWIVNDGKKWFNLINY